MKFRVWQFAIAMSLLSAYWAWSQGQNDPSQTCSEETIQQSPVVQEWLSSGYELVDTSRRVSPQMQGQEILSAKFRDPADGQIYKYSIHCDSAFGVEESAQFVAIEP